MKSAPAVALFLAFAAVGASAALHAQARGPATRAVRSNEQNVERPPMVVDEAARARRVSEMEAWLGRLVGRFRVDAKLVTIGGSDRIRGTATCSRFGDGQGARCVIQGIHRQKAQRDRGTLPLLYFGINPDALEIQIVVVALEQVSALSGVLEGDTVHFSDNWNVCHKIWTSCWMADEITARPSGEIFVKMAEDDWLQGIRAPVLLRSGHSLELEMNLNREPPGTAQPALTWPGQGLSF